MPVTVMMKGFNSPECKNFRRIYSKAVSEFESNVGKKRVCHLLPKNARGVVPGLMLDRPPLSRVRR
jgi:hypothetical protein